MCNGSSEPVTLPEMTCPECKGRRWAWAANRVSTFMCPNCNGTGKVPVVEDKTKENDVLVLSSQAIKIARRYDEAQLKQWSDFVERSAQDNEYLRQRIAELERQLLLAKENERFHRANVEKHDDGSFSVCWGDHEKGEECKYVRYYPEQKFTELEAQLQQERVERAEDVATLMRQIKLWSADFNMAEERISELKAQIPPTVRPMRVSSGTINTGFPYLAWTCPQCKRRKNIMAGEKNETPVGDRFCSCGVRFDWSNSNQKEK